MKPIKHYRKSPEPISNNDGNTPSMNILTLNIHRHFELLTL